MLNKYEELEQEIVKRIYKSFLDRFQGNKSEFARASHCSEATIRRVFRNEQRMTLNLLLRFCDALEIDIETLFI